MKKASWNGAVIAQSEDTVIVDNNHYFPPESLNKEFLKESNKTTVCGWKGTANYYNIEVNGQINENAAWYYAEPLPAAENIKGHVAFWNGVDIET